MRCFIEALKVFFVALGGDARSLAEPHSRLAEEARREAGVKPEQIRVSIGTEDPDDLLWDIEQALKHSR
ncbi:PLP-dependent transferase [Niveibacterium terrae]|uniref:PLP-dependent transferase n=1 Tax=Niveibacterium terrae TaxID=3373598 RepID=UPI003A93BA59